MLGWIRAILLFFIKTVPRSAHSLCSRARGINFVQISTFCIVLKIWHSAVSTAERHSLASDRPVHNCWAVKWAGYWANFVFCGYLACLLAREGCQAYFWAASKCGEALSPVGSPGKQALGSSTLWVPELGRQEAAKGSKVRESCRCILYICLLLSWLI